MNLQQPDVGTQADNGLPPGWTEGYPGGIATNTHPENGGIIDSVRGDGTWFIVFHRNELDVMHDLPTRKAAFETFAREMAKAPETTRVAAPLDKDALYRQTVAIQCRLNERAIRLGAALKSAGFQYVSSTSAFVRGDVRVYHSLGQPEIQRALDVLAPYSRYTVKTVHTAAVDIDDELECAKTQTLEKILAAVAAAEQAAT